MTPSMAWPARLRRSLYGFSAYRSRSAVSLCSHSQLRLSERLMYVFMTHGSRLTASCACYEPFKSSWHMPRPVPVDTVDPIFMFMRIVHNLTRQNLSHSNKRTALSSLG